MLRSLSLRNVGPSPALDIDLAPRMNFLTGDNGIGKSFLLDVAWWAMTGTWTGRAASPSRSDEESTISFSTQSHPDTIAYRFLKLSEHWASDNDLRTIPTPDTPLVIYAQLDGSIAVWDHLRRATNYDRAYLFTSAEVWNGKRTERRTLCEGLLRDWASWQRERNVSFEQLTRALHTLSPSPDHPLVPGALRRISLQDAMDHPTLQMPYGQDVPLVHASAGIRRIISLAYMLVWAWREHKHAASLTGEPMARSITLIIDEVEAHLHPQWQRVVVPALLRVAQEMTGHDDLATQLIMATHSPLVLASTETLFDPEKDAIWELDLRDGQVELSKYSWNRQGDASAWLTSSVFDLKEARSLPAEQAIEAARALLRQPPPSPTELHKVNEQLGEVLGEFDPFWVRWTRYYKHHTEDA